MAVVVDGYSLCAGLGAEEEGAMLSVGGKVAHTVTYRLMKL